MSFVVYFCSPVQLCLHLQVLFPNHSVSCEIVAFDVWNCEWTFSKVFGIVNDWWKLETTWFFVVLTYFNEKCTWCSLVFIAMVTFLTCKKWWSFTNVHVHVHTVYSLFIWNKMLWIQLSFSFVVYLFISTEWLSWMTEVGILKLCHITVASPPNQRSWVTRNNLLCKRLTGS